MKEKKMKNKIILLACLVFSFLYDAQSIHEVKQEAKNVKQKAQKNKKYYFSQHVLQRMQERHISFSDIKEVLKKGNKYTTKKVMLSVDLQKGIGVIYEPKSNTIITVYRGWDKQQLARWKRKNLPLEEPSASAFAENENKIPLEITEKSIDVELTDSGKVIESEKFQTKLLNISGYFRQFLKLHPNEPIKIRAGLMQGSSLKDLHALMNLIFSAKTKHDKEEAIQNFLKNLLIFEQPRTKEEHCARSEIKAKNRELRYELLMKVIAFMKMARSLQIPTLELACIKRLADYLDMNFNDVTAQRTNIHHMNFLNALFALPVEVQRKISNIFLKDAPHSQDRLNKINAYLIGKTTKCMTKSSSAINFNWSSDGQYLFYMMNPKSLPSKPTKNKTCTRWDNKTDKYARISSKGHKFELQTENIVAAKSPNDKYIAEFTADNKISVLDVQSNKVLQTFIFSHQPKKQEAISKLLWSPDSTKLAVGNFLPSFATWDDNGIRVYLVATLLKAREELFNLDLKPLFFTIQLLKAKTHHGFQFKTWSDKKIVFSPEQKEQYESLPESLRLLFKDKVATYQTKE
jgi:Domain of unknown function (DUF4258)